MRDPEQELADTVSERFPEARYDFRITTIRGLGYRLENGA